MKVGPRNLITDVAGLRVGNAQDDALKSGCTVLVGDAPFTAAVHVMGGAPGTRETDLLAPDKLVQEAIRLILEAYYEPQFRDSSHGFRPQRSCHTALKRVKEQWTGAKWFIEGDIKGCFDNIRQTKLLELLGQRIQDNRFLKLLREMLNAGYVEDWQYHQTHSGTTAGSRLDLSFY